ncbi:GNAT family N-acetyltransferase [Vitiosangium sp. GDMCC 1.1324]|uniref:GNAT family N-acetyltransferase n=1 Tax=Vitiosangium sp. (strain GDMCC 1.1324) TaxID=2138576 RepID=UPI000D39E724|nr:GNAT family N-acetyltransferase [Vitiosangium sp. GDMCC 1.1324]PTL79354.1 GNAT family N-acetyltransferase [Vitiosangium sp. GDMCC 1.1324]
MRPSLHLRPYHPDDRGAVYDICVRTGAAGQDARGLYRSDELLPDVYAGPYLELEPQLAFVVDEGGRAVGYVLGTADTPAFVEAWRTRWLPRVAGRHPRPAEPAITADERLIATLHHPEWMLAPELAPHPAHLHVNLLPHVQGGGYGRRLVETFLAAAAASGAPSLHLGTSNDNTLALRFYERLGFQRLTVAGAVGTTYFQCPTGTRG